jgi:tRNA (guanine-N7-)-methyltransferase
METKMIPHLPRRFRADLLPRFRVAGEVFSLPQPFRICDLEIGCGVGWHPLMYAQRHPDRYLVALEHGKTRFEKFQRRVNHHAYLPNLCALSEDAIPFLTHRMSSESLDRVMIFYPNPYPKPSQAKKRFHRMPFFEVLRDRMKPGGVLELRSNVESYGQEAREALVRLWGMALVQEQRIQRVTHPDFRCETHFERKTYITGHSLWHLTFKKPEFPVL